MDKLYSICFDELFYNTRKIKIFSSLQVYVLLNTCKPNDMEEDRKHESMAVRKRAIHTSTTTTLANLRHQELIKGLIYKIFYLNISANKTHFRH